MGLIKPLVLITWYREHENRNLSECHVLCKIPGEKGPERELWIYNLGRSLANLAAMGSDTSKVGIPILAWASRSITFNKSYLVSSQIHSSLRIPMSRLFQGGSL